MRSGTGIASKSIRLARRLPAVRDKVDTRVEVADRANLDKQYHRRLRGLDQLLWIHYLFSALFLRLKSDPMCRVRGICQLWQIRDFRSVPSHEYVGSIAVDEMVGHIVRDFPYLPLALPSLVAPANYCQPCRSPYVSPLFVLDSVVFLTGSSLVCFLPPGLRLPFLVEHYRWIEMSS